MKRLALSCLLAAGLAVAGAEAHAATPEELLALYAEQARRADPAFAGFSAQRGQALYYREFEMETGEILSCAACHHEDPRRERFAHHDPIPCSACHRFHTGSFEEMPRIRRQLLPLAPSANPDRFRDLVQTEKWFGMNCRLLMQRDCTPLEKGDVITWLLTIR
jgi:hypothetical protein